jgi:hypothetical protein
MSPSTKSTLMASLIGSVVGMGTWLFGIDKQLWPQHPQVADFLVTIAVTVLTSAFLAKPATETAPK